MSRPVTAADVMTPELLARLMADRDAYWLNDPAQPDIQYYCVRCHRHHFHETAIGKRHAVQQPERLVPRG